MAIMFTVCPVAPLYSILNVSVTQLPLIVISHYINTTVTWSIQEQNEALTQNVITLEHFQL